MEVETAYNLTSKAGNNFANAQYNGNISGMTWKSDGDDIRRRYDFTYDGANRLLKGDFKQNNSGTTWNKTLVDFTVQMGNSGADDGTAYDANGNILKMKQWGLKLTGPAQIDNQIDNLTYTYWSNGNMLKAVADTNTADHQLGDFTNKNTTTTDYGYDKNGNLVIDLNKRINGMVAAATGMSTGGGIVYNHLNLPSQITVRNNANTADKGTINYIYDAAGVKLQKITTENSVSVTYGGSPVTTNITTTTTYLNGAVFESKQYSDGTVNTGLGYIDRLQFFSHEEGRIRGVNNSSNPDSLTGLDFDYMIKDHLGNVRMVLTEEVKQDEYPAATMETAQAATENTFYSNLDATRVNRPSGYTDTYTDPNDKVALVRGDGNKIGPAILLKVMAGDRFNVKASAWWTGSSSGSNTSPLTSIVSALISGAPGVSGGKIGIADLTSTLLDPQVSLFLDNDQPAVSGKPKAYLNWILFDEQFKYVGNGNSGAEAVEASGVVKQFNRSDQPVNQNGYLYIYTSNETSYDVFFDNLQVTHIRGSLLEETHYYPFGLTMAGISAKALEFGNPENKYKYNGIEKESDLGLEIYDAQLRELDGQTGRWWQIDPKTANMEMWSPYASNYNNPIRYSDPLGDEGQDCCQWLKDAGNWIADKGMQAVVWVNNNINPVTPLAELAIGKSLNSGFTENKPRSESATQAALFLLPTAKAEALVVNEVKNLVVTQIEKQAVVGAEKKLVGGEAANAVKQYEVGAANDLKKRSVVGDGLDIHHVSQSKPAGQIIDGYKKETAPAIAISEAEHAQIPRMKGSTTAGTPRQQLAKDIWDLRKYTNAPNSSLQKLIDLNKKIFPSAYTKP